MNTNSGNTGRMEIKEVKARQSNKIPVAPLVLFRKPPGSTPPTVTHHCLQSFYLICLSNTCRKSSLNKSCTPRVQRLIYFHIPVLFYRSHLGLQTTMVNVQIAIITLKTEQKKQSHGSLETSGTVLQHHLKITVIK